MSRRPRVETFPAPGGRLRVECRVYDTRRQLLRAVRADNARGGRKGVASDTVAYCSTMRAVIPRTHLAVVYFCRAHFDHDTIAHEMVHAAFALMARRGRKSVPCTRNGAPPTEEEHATIAGELVGALCRRFAIHV